MILIMKILLHNEYKIINLWYPTYVYQFFNFPYNNKNRVLACFQTRPDKALLHAVAGCCKPTMSGSSDCESWEDTASCSQDIVEGGLRSNASCSKATSSAFNGLTLKFINV